MNLTHKQKSNMATTDLMEKEKKYAEYIVSKKQCQLDRHPRHKETMTCLLLWTGGFFVRCREHMSLWLSTSHAWP
jgi:hypothetical protein